VFACHDLQVIDPRVAHQYRTDYLTCAKSQMPIIKIIQIKKYNCSPWNEPIGSLASKCTFAFLQLRMTTGPLGSTVRMPITSLIMVMLDFLLPMRRASTTSEKVSECGGRKANRQCFPTVGHARTRIARLR
jgi:hypothetical protein